MSESYPQPSPVSKPLLSNRGYNLLKWLSAFVLPALSVLYVSLGQMWDFPKIEEVVGSITAVNTFLGGLLAYSTKSYNQSDSRFDGEFEIREGQNPRLVMNEDPESFEPNRNLSIRIVKKGDITS